MGKTILMSLVCAGLIVILPIEFLLGGLIWIPALLRVAYKFGRRRGSAFLAVIALIVAAAIARPNAYDQKRFGPFAGNTATLGELGNARAIFPQPGFETITIVLPSARPTKLEILSAITNQTKLCGRLFHCGSGCNLLSGSYSGPIQLRERE